MASKPLPDNVKQLKKMLLSERLVSDQKDQALAQKELEINRLKQSYQQIL